MTSAEPTEGPKSQIAVAKAPFVGTVVLLGLVCALAAWTVQRIAEARSEQAEVVAARERQAREMMGGHRPLAVSTVRPVGARWRPDVELSGSLEATRVAKLGFQVPGVLESIAVNLGQEVEKGQVLARLDSRKARAQLSVNTAEVQAAEAKLALARDEATRTVELVRGGAARAADQVHVEQQQAFTAARLEASRAHAVLARLSLASHTLTAPFRGTVVRLPPSEGAVVAAGEPLVEVVDVGVLTLRGTIREADAALVAAGTPVALETEGGEVPGVVRAVLSVLDRKTRRVPIEAEFANPGSLRSGMFVLARARGLNEVNVVKLPRAALKAGSNDEVFVLQPDSTVKSLRIVCTVARDGELVVRSGLDTSDSVVLEPPPELKSGDKVNAVTLGALGNAP